jgi:hypothetical protein
MVDVAVLFWNTPGVFYTDASSGCTVISCSKAIVFSSKKKESLVYETSSKVTFGWHSGT